MNFALRGLIAASAAVIVAAGLTSVSADADAPAPPSRAALQAELDAVVAGGAPGVSVEVRDENGTWVGVAGVGDRRTQRAPDPGGEIRVGSITKSFVATVVLQLVAEGRVGLGAPISTYLPGLLPYPQPITVHELLQHRSGLFDYAQPGTLWPTIESIDTQRYRTHSVDELIGLAIAKPLDFAPGSQYEYSNTNYLVLAELIEKVTGRPVRAELYARIIGRLGLVHTYLAGAFPLLPRPAERGYERLTDGGPLIDFTSYNMTWAFTAGAMVSTAHDLNRFYAALFTGRLLPPAQLAQMEHTVVTTAPNGYGLGLQTADICGLRILGHNGGLPGYSTYSFATADVRRQITISVNQDLSQTADTADAIENLLVSEFCGTGSAGTAVEIRTR